MGTDSHITTDRCPYLAFEHGCAPTPDGAQAQGHPSRNAMDICEPVPSWAAVTTSGISSAVGTTSSRITTGATTPRTVSTDHGWPTCTSACPPRRPCWIWAAAAGFPSLGSLPTLGTA